MYFLPWEQEAGGSNPLAPTTFFPFPCLFPRHVIRMFAVPLSISCFSRTHYHLYLLTLILVQ